VLFLLVVVTLVEVGVRGGEEEEEEEEEANCEPFARSEFSSFLNNLPVTCYYLMNEERE